jgi:hypothetical protein
MTEKLGHDAILAAYPEFRSLFVDLNRVRTKIAQSRGDRESREKIYSVIENSDFVGLVDRYNELRESEPIMKAIARKQRRMFVLSIISVCVGIVLVILTSIKFVFFGL